jgi:ankyrin repeat protein
MKIHAFIVSILLTGSHFVIASDLMDAIVGGQRDLALNMIAEGVDVSELQTDGTSALMYAAYLGDAEMAATLIKAGADPSLANSYGTSAILEATIV